MLMRKTWHGVHTSWELTVLKRIAFFAEAHNPGKAKMDVVGATPVADLDVLEQTVAFFRGWYPAAFTSAETGYVNLLSPGELRELWSTAAARSQRLVYDAGTYKLRRDTTPFAYDLVTLRQLLEAGGEVGGQIQVFYHL
jgi:hypothetical protein